MNMYQLHSSLLPIDNKQKAIPNMKNIILTLLMGIVSIITYAQTESTHLKFKGIPIDGPLDEFVSKLESKGFEAGENLLNLDDRAFLYGNFAGHNNCTIIVQRTPSDIVCAVGVIFEPKDSWQLLESSYMNLKLSLLKKYGTPSSCTEEFQTPIQPKNNKEKFSSMMADECTYETHFDAGNGNIVLRLDRFDLGLGAILIMYTDSTNLQIYLKDTESDL